MNNKLFYSIIASIIIFFAICMMCCRYKEEMSKKDQVCYALPIAAISGILAYWAVPMIYGKIKKRSNVGIIVQD